MKKVRNIDEKEDKEAVDLLRRRLFSTHIRYLSLLSLMLVLLLLGLYGTKAFSERLAAFESAEDSRRATLLYEGFCALSDRLDSTESSDLPPQELLYEIGRMQGALSVGGEDIGVDNLRRYLERLEYDCAATVGSIEKRERYAQMSAEIHRLTEEGVGGFSASSLYRLERKISPYLTTR